MFSRKKSDTEDRKMSDAPDDLGIPMKPARPAGQAANVAPLGRGPTPVPPRTPDQPRPAAEAPRPGDAATRSPVPAPTPRRSEDDLRKLIVGRELSGVVLLTVARGRLAYEAAD